MVIYKITNLINNKVYIGQTVQYSTRRLVNHRYYLRLNKHYNEHLQRAWNKYGENNFKFEFIEKLNSLEELNTREQYWISFFKSNNENFGYNLDLGGRNNRVSETTKEKIRQKMLGNTHSKGKKQNLTEEQRKKRSEVTINYNKNRKISDETRRKMSEAFKGEKSRFYGKPAFNRKRVKCINNNTIYQSATEASKSLNCDRSTICAICRGKIKQTKGYTFIYID